VFRVDSPLDASLDNPTPFASQKVIFLGLDGVVLIDDFDPPVALGLGRHRIALAGTRRVQDYCDKHKGDQSDASPQSLCFPPPEASLA
jgi:hypothetical protein